MASATTAVEPTRRDDAVRSRAVRSRRAGWPRVLLHAAWITALCGWAVARIGRFGFNPTDQGYVLALSWRILHGELPHTDIISARPLGSAVLHTVDFLLPGPLFVASSFVVMLEIVIATIALAALITGRSPLAWGPLRTLLVAAAALVNLHTFPLMAWHTIDGIFLVATGWWALDAGLRSGSPPVRRVGLLLVGFALITKQSFAVAGPATVAMLVLHPAGWLRGRHAGPGRDRADDLGGPGGRGRRRWRRLAADLCWLGAVPLGYLAVVTISGGLRPAIDQLTGGAQTWGERLFQIWDVEPARRSLLLLAGLLALLGVAWLARGRLGAMGRWVRLLLVAGSGLIVLDVAGGGQLARAGDWAIVLAWMLLFAAVLTWVVSRHFPWQPLLLVLLAWMASLSWGYPSPTLLGGSLALGVLDLLIRSVPMAERLSAWSKPAGTVVGVLVGLLVGLIAVLGAGLAVTEQHDRAPYVDLPQGMLTADLGSATPAMRWVRTNPSVHDYVSQIRGCTERYPAAKVAVLTDNAFAYPAFGLRNPFPMDWPAALELVGDARARMLDTVEALNRDGNYLVLFQTVQFDHLAAGRPIPAQVPPDAPIVANTELEGRIQSGLQGQRISCGSFVGVWQP